MSQADLAFKIAAVNVQLREHLCPAYMEEFWPCKSYKTLNGHAAGTFWPIAILDNIGTPNAVGWHDFQAGLAYGRVTANSDPQNATTESHEACELRMDPECSIWLPMPDGRKIAREVCDPCQENSYAIDVTIGSETRSIFVSDFVLPAYFVEGAQRPYSYLDAIDEPFGLSRSGGGWRLLKDRDGKVTSDFGRFPRNVRAMASRAVDARSRTYRRGFRG